MKGRLVKGQLDACIRGKLTGWAWFPKYPEVAAVVQAVVDGEVVGSATADLERDDLKQANMRGGACAFELPLTWSGFDPPFQLELRVVGAAVELAGGSVEIDSLAETIRFGPAGVFAKRPSEDPAETLSEAETGVPTPVDFPTKAEPPPAPKPVSGHAVEHFAEALRRERADLDRAGDTGSAATLVLLGGADDDQAVESLALWGLQSNPDVDVVALGGGLSLAAAEDALSKANWCVFARPGDMVHPSIAAMLQAQSRTTDVVLWSLFLPDPHNPSTGVVHRRPAYDPHTIRHNPSLDTTFAVKGTALRGCPSGVLDALAAGRAHPLLFWLSTRPDLRWRTWLEALTVRTNRRSSEPFISRPAVAGDMDLYLELAQAVDANFDLRETAIELPVPFVLAPRRRPAKISVITPVGAGEERAVLRALYWLARQRTTAALEILLVGSPREVESAAIRMFGHDNVIAVPTEAGSLDQGFNRGAQAALGEVLVFHDPQAEVESDETLIEELAAWALVPGIGTVGCGLKVDGRSIFGLTGARQGEDLYSPILSPDVDEAYSLNVRACAGNTLRLSAIARSKFNAVGGVDALGLPGVLQDVEFMLRCVRHGLTHLYLGHLRASIDGGATPPAETHPMASSQLRQYYPEAAQASLFVLERRAVPPAGLQAPGAGMGYSTADLERLAQAAVRRTGADDDFKRSVIAEVARVTEASGQLLSALERLHAMTSAL